MPTYEELKSQRTGIEKICNLLRTHNGLICLIFGILCISIMFLYIPFGAMGTIQKIVVLITCLLFVINVYLFALSRKKKELPHIAHFPKIALTLTCIFALVVAVFKENGSIPFLLMGLVLCIINYSFSLSYSKYWNVPDDLLRKLVKIECLGVIIALLQLIIAFPQLRLAYESATSSDITKFQKSIEDYNKHIEAYNFINIPDSLQDIEVRRAKEYQQKLYAYSLYLAHTNFDNITKPDTLYHSIKNNLWLNSFKIQECKRINYDFIMVHRVEMDAMTLIDKINSYYISTSDSIFFIAGAWKNMLNTISCKLEKNCKNSDNTNKQIEKSSEIIADCTNKNLESSIREKIIDKEIKKITEIFNYQIKEEVKSDMISDIDYLCLDFMKKLDMIQLKHAYKVNF